MDLFELGSWGYRFGAVGIIVFTMIFLAVVRWWTDLLGRVLMVVFGATSAIVAVSIYRSVTQDNSLGFLWFRAVVYWAFGAGMWAGLGSFIWYQFLAPRSTRRRKAKHEQESAVAAFRPAADGGSHDRAGSDR